MRPQGPCLKAFAALRAALAPNADWRRPEPDSERNIVQERAIEAHRHHKYRCDQGNLGSGGQSRAPPHSAAAGV